MQHPSMLMGAVLLGLLAFAGRIFDEGLLRWKALIWVTFLFIIGLGVMVTQTRAAWLALIISLFTMVLVFLCVRLRRPSAERTSGKNLYWVAIPTVVVVLVATLFLDDFKGRFLDEAHVVSSLLSFDIASIPYSSIGIRIHTWHVALDWFQERPFFGWGGNADQFVIQQSQRLPADIKEQFGHLHNSYLHILVTYGIVGFAFFSFVFCWLARACFSAWRQGVMPGDVALFGVCFMVYWLLVNITESYLTYWTGTYVMAVVLGGLFSYYLRARYVLGRAA